MEQFSFRQSNPEEYGYGHQCGGPPCLGAVICTPTKGDWPRLRISVDRNCEPSAWFRESDDWQIGWDRVEIPKYLQFHATELKQTAFADMEIGES
jgi:hypothetical protein